VPAAAVIPAPIAYIKIVDVKKLVVDFRPQPTGPLSECVLDLVGALPPGEPAWPLLVVSGNPEFYFE
jgi:hypothetical protein